MLSSTGDRRAEYLLRSADGIRVGGVEERKSRLEANVDKPRCIGDVAAPPRAIEVGGAAKSCGAEAERGNSDPCTTQCSRLHRALRAIGPVFVARATLRAWSSNQAREDCRRKARRTRSHVAERFPGSADGRECARRSARHTGFRR